MNASSLSFALELAAQGLNVFPCLPTKAPACPGGFHAATTDPASVKALWHRWPGELIGVPTGARNNFDVLDIDPRHGGDAWHAKHLDRLPQTRIHETRSGGLHILFPHRDGVRNSAGKVAPGIDVRGDGGFVVWWPACGCPVRAEGPLAAWPVWLLPQVLPPTQPPLLQPAAIPDGKFGDRYTEAAIRRAVEHVASAGEGGRNDALNRETFALARFVRSGTMTAGDLAEAMATAGLSAGLPPREVQATLASALRAGDVA
jgi:hypothetical protein